MSKIFNLLFKLEKVSTLGHVISINTISITAKDGAVLGAEAAQAAVILVPVVWSASTVVSVVVVPVVVVSVVVVPVVVVPVVVVSVVVVPVLVVPVVAVSSSSICSSSICSGSSSIKLSCPWC